MISSPTDLPNLLLNIQTIAEEVRNKLMDILLPLLAGNHLISIHLFFLKRVSMLYECGRLNQNSKYKTSSLS